MQPADDAPNGQWDRHLPARGHTAVDFERRVDRDRLRRDRPARTRKALREPGCGALLTFDVNNIRHISGTKTGEGERDKRCRFALLAADEEPFVRDFSSAAVHHRESRHWLLPERMRVGVLGMGGTIPPAFGLRRHHAEEIASDRGACTTGEIVRVDGGFHVLGMPRPGNLRWGSPAAAGGAAQNPSCEGFLASPGRRS